LTPAPDAAAEIRDEPQTENQGSRAEGASVYSPHLPFATLIFAMWFKNLVVYRLPAGWSMSAAELEERLAKRALVACGPYDMVTRGWVFPSPAHLFVHTVQRQHLIALGVDQKLLPSSIIRQVAVERAAELTQEQGYPVSRRQMRELKEKVTEELRARALTKRSQTRAWIDPDNGWFVVDAAGDAKADELVTVLRETLDTFAVTLLETESSPSRGMAAWLMLGDAPLRFAIDQDLEMQNADKTKATIRYARHPLEGKEIQQHLQTGKYVTRMGLTWSDRIAFILTEKLQLKRVQFLDINKESAQDEQRDPLEQFDIDFALMSGEFAQLLSDLEEALGGQAEKKAA
jgi:recombination associated protein RdgC